MYSNRTRLTPNELVLRLDEFEQAMRLPGADGHLKKAEALAMYIVRSAPNGAVANLAMLLMSAARRADQPDGDASLQKALSDLRSALKAAQASRDASA